MHYSIEEAAQLVELGLLSEEKYIELGGKPQKSKTVKGSKYYNKKIYVYKDGMEAEEGNLAGHGEVVERFDSKKEFQRWKELNVFLESGAIDKLERQKKFILQPGFTYQGEYIRPITYVADFFYFNNVKQKFIVEDVKPYDKKSAEYLVTKDFKIKMKMMQYHFPGYDFVLN